MVLNPMLLHPMMPKLGLQTRWVQRWLSDTQAASFKDQPGDRRGAVGHQQG
jgi:hypothetical protein